MLAAAAAVTIGARTMKRKSESQVEQAVVEQAARITLTIIVKLLLKRVRQGKICLAAAVVVADHIQARMAMVGMVAVVLSSFVTPCQEMIRSRNMCSLVFLRFRQQGP